MACHSNHNVGVIKMPRHGATITAMEFKNLSHFLYISMMPQ